MTQRDEWLAAAFRSRADDSEPRRDCPSPDRIWDAARLQMSLDDRLEVVDHVSRCAACAEAWELAIEFGAGERAETGERAVRPQLDATSRRSLEMQASSPLGGIVGRNALPIAGATLLVITLASVVVLYRQPPSLQEATPQGTVATEVPATYRIKAVLNREQDGITTPVKLFERLSLSDRLSMEIEISAPLYVYVVKGDERGNSVLLFPSPDGGVENPLPAGVHRLPDMKRDRTAYLDVTPGGGRQHLIVIASPTRAMLDEMFTRLPRSPVRNPSSIDSQLSTTEPGKLRSLYGIVLPPAVTGGEPYADRWFHDPLPAGEETARGVWIREATYEYPSVVGGLRFDDVTGLTPNDVESPRRPVPRSK